MADYQWRHASAIPDPDARSPHRWLAQVWENGSPALARVMPLGWRYGLGLRLDPGPDRILGWEVVAADEQSATVAATSRLVTMTNTVELDGHDLVWTTTVDYRNRLGRALWQVARFSHEALMPLLIRRATRPD